jgi:hypothetical protein
VAYALDLATLTAPTTARKIELWDGRCRSVARWLESLESLSALVSMLHFSYISDGGRGGFSMALAGER